MLFHITKKLGEWLELSKLPSPPEVFDKLYSWRVNLTQEEDFEFIVFMNEASRYVVAVNKPDKGKKLSEMLFETLRGTLLADNINPAVIDRYIAECGDVKNIRNLGRKETAWLNKATDNVWFAMRDSDESFAISQTASSARVPPFTGAGFEEYYRPDEKFYSMLAEYGLPLRKGTAFDLTARLDLDGKDAVRKLRVSSNMTFEQLHKVLQKAFGWKNCHLHSFGLFKEWSEDYYAMPDVELVTTEEDFESNPDAKLVHGVMLLDYLPEFTKILYHYDFGDDWHHYIEIESVIDDCTDDLPLLLSGNGDAPPEDVGGTMGFAEFIRVYYDRKDDEHDFQTSWAKRQFWKPFEFESVADAVKRSLDS
jgi:hypothetical protein